MKLMKKLQIISIALSVGLLAGCQSLNTELQKVNDDLLGTPDATQAASPSDASNTSNTMSSTKTTESNSVPALSATDSASLSWLAQDDISWNDQGKLQNINWYDYWSQQIEAHTLLSKKAYQYCHPNVNQSTKVGTNCDTYFQAYSMVKARDSQQFGNQLEKTE